MVARPDEDENSGSTQIDRTVDLERKATRAERGRGPGMVRVKPHAIWTPQAPRRGEDRP
jgi:hypothetical protein